MPSFVVACRACLDPFCKEFFCKQTNKQFKTQTNKPSGLDHLVKQEDKNLFKELVVLTYTALLSATVLRWRTQPEISGGMFSLNNAAGHPQCSSC